MLEEIKFGGSFVPELLIEPLKELTKAWNEVKNSSSFQSELQEILTHYVGRPTPLTEVKRFSAAINGPRIFLKREDLLHTGAHKINNTIGQCLLAKRMGKTRVIAETGAGQHGVATATACAFLDLECVIYMGKKDMMRQSPNVKKMELLGATVVSIDKGSKTLKEAVNEALRDWAKNYENSHYCLGSALGPAPYPDIVASFQKVIGDEVKAVLTPDLIIACVGGGSNAIGIFAPFLDEPSVKMIGVEGGGISDQKNAARFSGGKKGVFHGCYSYVLLDEMGQVKQTHSISAGLDYPMVGPTHAMLYETKRVEYTFARDKEALDAFHLLAKTEGIIPALESSHALAHMIKIASSLPKTTKVVINLSGRGDKDLPEILK